MVSAPYWSLASIHIVLACENWLMLVCTRLTHSQGKRYRVPSWLSVMPMYQVLIFTRAVSLTVTHRSHPTVPHAEVWLVTGHGSLGLDPAQDLRAKRGCDIQAGCDAILLMRVG